MIVWLASYPRSGNTFLRIILNNVFGVKTCSIYNDKLDIGADEKTSTVVGHEDLAKDFNIEKARLDTKIYYIKTHELLDNITLCKTDKVIYLVRDGRESSLSFSKYLKAYSDDTTDLLMVIQGVTPYGSWAEHINQWANVKNKLVIMFETLTADPESQIDDIGNYLNLKVENNYIPTFLELKKINPTFFRSGKKDSWKNNFTRSEHLFFWLSSVDEMLLMGYEDEMPDEIVNGRVIEYVSEFEQQITLLRGAFRTWMNNTYDHLLELQEVSDKKRKKESDNLSNHKNREIYRLKNRLKDKSREVYRLENRLHNQKDISERRRLELLMLRHVERENQDLKHTENNFNTLTNYIEKMSSISTLTSPIRKIKICNEMILTCENMTSDVMAIKKKSPTFTIVTVVYNAENDIEETIKSVTDQTYKDCEYIVIDGNSTDNTLDIVKKYDANITNWISEIDSGIYDAMNKGIDMASGNWVSFMNAGDTFASSDTLSKIAEKINANSDVIYGDRYYIKKGKSTFQKAKHINTIFEKMPFGHQSVLIKNSVIKKYKFNDTYKFAADYNLLMQLYLKKYIFQYVEIPICNFLSGGHSESGLRPYLEVLKILFDNCDDKEIIEKNIYFDAFRNHSENLINKSIGK